MEYSSYDPLKDALNRSRNAALLLGAGISVKNGIPGGYKLFLEFGQENQPLLNRHHLLDRWEVANSSKDWRLHKQSVDEIISVFPADEGFQETLLHWIMAYPAMQGEPSDEHAVFVTLWLKRKFRHLITTNWDFLLEHQIETLYDTAYLDPFEPAELTLTDGSSFHVEPEALFYMDPLDGDDFAWNPRWDIVANDRDLVELERWGRPIWKIHGSPFFLSCSLCRGINRWKRSVDLHVGEACPEHPHVPLQPEIIFWGYGVDTMYPKVWQTLKRRLSRCDLILVSGFSGSDTYLKSFLEGHPDVWLVNPNPDEWDPGKLSFISDKATGLTRELLSFL